MRRPGLLFLRSELLEGCQAVPEGMEWKRLVYFKKDEGRLWSLRGSRKKSGPTSHAWFPGTEKHRACGLPEGQVPERSFGWVWPRKRPGESGMVCGTVVL